MIDILTTPPWGYATVIVLTLVLEFVLWGLEELGRRR